MACKVSSYLHLLMSKYTYKVEYWVCGNCFLFSPIFWKAHISRLQFSSLVFINQRKIETKLLLLFLDFKFPYEKLIFFMCDEVYYSLCKRKHCEISIIYWNIDYIFCLFYWNFRLYILLNTSCEIVLFPGAKGNIMESLYINGVHWPKKEDIKASTMFIKTMAWENVLHCFYKPA